MLERKTVNKHKSRFGHKTTTYKSGDLVPLMGGKIIESDPSGVLTQGHANSEISRFNLYKEILQGERDVEAGRTINARESIERMKQRYHLR